MFDFGSSSTVPWKLAVLSTSATLYACHLYEGMSEEDLVWELVQNGVHFCTLQCHNTLNLVPMERFSVMIAPMRLSIHVFDKRDHDFYEKQCQSFFSLQCSHATLLQGGYVWCIVSKYINFSEAVRGSWGIHNVMNEMFRVEDSNGIKYIDDNLMDNELEILCGVYRIFTGG
ncbi:hypothetical protein P691DRAFT_845665 [Macrolepiota fuliginosa MF-IS2]|uniref:Uncharacterized protein n=1 Tax=Macrolepiota fuliginosa MF-IS2 TaxID=1400762 RepID=A0A9P5X3A0_9AGAR|nr:hypothetical protein P691DRAFT_845665 [Macrolepiota fuliginosa MF-IS2]